MALNVMFTRAAIQFAGEPNPGWGPLSTVRRMMFAPHERAAKAGSQSSDWVTRVAASTYPPSSSRRLR